MNRQRERDEFIAIIAQEGGSVELARQLLRAGRTLHRLAELECSSEAADRDRIPCPAGNKYAPKDSPCLCEHWGKPEGVFAVGDWVRWTAHASEPGKGLTYTKGVGRAKDEGRAGGWDVYDVAVIGGEEGEEVSVYGFSIVPDSNCGCPDPDEPTLHHKVTRISVQGARCEARVRKLLPSGWTPIFNGDPRGAVLKVKVPSGRTNDWGREGVCVP